MRVGQSMTSIDNVCLLVCDSNVLTLRNDVRLLDQAVDVISHHHELLLLLG